MNHSLGALLAQKNDQGQEQTIHYLSRTMIGADHRYNPIEKKCLALVFAVQKMWHYLVAQTIQVISKINSFNIAYDEAIVTEWSMGKIGHVSLPIWDTIPTIKDYERTGSGRLLGWAPRSNDDQTLWRSPRRGRWSLLDPDVFRMTGVTTLLWRRIKNGSSRKYRSRSGRSTYLPTELCNPLRILINWAIFQQCSRIQCSLNRDANRRWDWSSKSWSIRWLKAHH